MNICRLLGAWAAAPPMPSGASGTAAAAKPDFTTTRREIMRCPPLLDGRSLAFRTLSREHGA
jgi:hypothetical protein